MDKNPLREGNAYVRQREDPLEVTRPTQAEELLLPPRLMTVKHPQTHFGSVAYVSFSSLPTDDEDDLETPKSVNVPFPTLQPPHNHFQCYNR